MKRGDVYLASAGSGYSGKPRPVVVVQPDALGELASVVVCPLSTSSPVDGRLRLAVEADEANGLDGHSVIMVDKVTAVSVAKFGPRIGTLRPPLLRRLNRSLALVVGLSQPV